METIRPRRLDVALLSTLFAVGTHAYLAKQHYALKFGLGAGASLCNINATFNCDAVAASSWSSLFGIPLAVWGMMANLVLFVLLTITRLGWTDDRENAARYSLWMATLVAAASVAMGGISLLFMPTYCLFCMIAYILSFAGLYFTWTGVGGFSKNAEALAALVKENKWALILFAAVPAGAFLWNLSSVKNVHGTDVDLVVREKVELWRGNPVATFDETRGLVHEAKSTPARITIVEFADFLCPHCKHAVPSLHAFVSAHPDVKFIFKSFPLDGSCSPQGGPGDGIRCAIAAAVHCEERLTKKGWDAQRWFFDHQEEMFGVGSPKQALEAYCQANARDCAPLQACVDSPESKDEIRAMIQEGLDAQIRGTPAIFVNGKRLDLGQQLPVLEGVYRAQ